MGRIFVWMRKPIVLVLVLFAAGLLLCLLAYPFGYDQSVFAVAGELSVKHGAVTYRDFLDTKPPLIFTIYGVALSIFGHHEWAPRLFDALIQALSMVLFYRFLVRTTSDKGLALGSTLLYVILYVTSGYWMTGQSETFAILPTVWLLSLTERARGGDKALLRGAQAGVASVILFLLKFTLLLVPVGACVYLFSVNDQRLYKDAIRLTLGGVVALCAGLGLVLIYMSSVGAVTPFFQTLDWLRGYAGIDPLLSMHTIAELFYRQFPLATITAFLPTTAILAVLGILYLKQNSRPPSSIYTHLLIQLGLGLFGVLYERKFFPYHYSRVFFAFTPFVVVGTRAMVLRTREYLRSVGPMSGIPRISRTVGVTLIVGVAIFYSPVVRILTNPLYFAKVQLSGGDVGAAADGKFGGLYFTEQVKAAAELKQALRPNETIFLWGNNVGLYFRTEAAPRTICLTNTPLVTSWTPEDWKQKLLSQLRTAPPQFFVCETVDARPYITGDTLDSRQHLEQWTELSQFVHSDYHDWKTIGHFVIFERN